MCRRNSVAAANMHGLNSPTSQHYTYQSTYQSAGTGSSPTSYVQPSSGDSRGYVQHPPALTTRSSPAATSAAMSGNQGSANVFCSTGNGSARNAAADGAAGPVRPGVGEGLCEHPMHAQDCKILMPSSHRLVPMASSDVSGASSPGVLLPCPPRIPALPAASASTESP